MSEYITLAFGALIGLLVPATGGWLWTRVKTELQSGNAKLAAQIGEIQAEQKTMRDEHTAMKAVQMTQGEAIAYLQGADSQRSQTAIAALEAAQLLLHPRGPQIPHPDQEQ